MEEDKELVVTRVVTMDETMVGPRTTPAVMRPTTSSTPRCSNFAGLANNSRGEQRTH